MEIIKATIRMENMRDVQKITINTKDVPKVTITNALLLALQKILKVQLLQKNNN